MNFINYNNLYLNYDGLFSLDPREAMPIFREEISNNNCGTEFFRIKYGFDIYFYVSEKDEICLKKMEDKLNQTGYIFYTQIGKIFSLSNGKYLYNFGNKMMLNTSVNMRHNNWSNIFVNFSNYYSSPVDELYKCGLIVLKENLSDLMPFEFNKAKEIINNQPHKRISNLLETDYCFQDLLSHKSIKDFLNILYGESKYHLTTYSSNRVNKDNSQMDWHVDYPYHNFQFLYPTETLGIQILILLDDFTLNNGATEYITGSHTYLFFPTEKSIENQTINKLVAKKGSIVIWLGKLWHREGKSTVDEYRSALLANFSPLKIDAKDNVLNMFKNSKFQTEAFKEENNKIMYK